MCLPTTLTIMNRVCPGSLIEKSPACTKTARSLFVVANTVKMGQNTALQGSTSPDRFSRFQYFVGIS